MCRARREARLYRQGKQHLWVSAKDGGAANLGHCQWIDSPSRPEVWVTATTTGSLLGGRRAVQGDAGGRYCLFFWYIRMKGLRGGAYEYIKGE